LLYAQVAHFFYRRQYQQALNEKAPDHYQAFSQRGGTHIHPHDDHPFYKKIGQKKEYDDHGQASTEVDIYIWKPSRHWRAIFFEPAHFFGLGKSRDFVRALERAMLL